MTIKKSTKYNISNDFCPCCGANNTMVWTAENGNNQYQVATCGSCGFEHIETITKIKRNEYKQPAQP